METSSIKGSGILPNLQQSLQSGIFDHDLLHISPHGVLIDGDIPLQSRTQQYNLHNNQAMEFGNPDSLHEPIHGNSMRGSHINQSVRFADQLETLAVESQGNSQRGSTVAPTVLKNKSHLDLPSQLTIKRVKTQQIVMPKTSQNAYHQQQAEISHRSPMLSPRQSGIEIVQNNMRPGDTFVSNTNETHLRSSHHSRASGIGIAPSASQMAPLPPNPITNLRESNVTTQNLNNILNRTLNQSVIHEPPPLLSRVPSLTGPTQSISKRTIVNVNQSVHQSNSESGVSHQQLHQQQTIQKQDSIDPSNLIGNASNVSNNQRFVHQQSMVNSQYSHHNLNILDTRKSNFSSNPLPAENQITNTLAGGIATMTQSRVEMGSNVDQASHIEQALAAEAAKNLFRKQQASILNSSYVGTQFNAQPHPVPVAQTGMINSQAHSARFNQSQISNPNNISQVLAETVANNMMTNSHISKSNHQPPFPIRSVENSQHRPPPVDLQTSHISIRSGNNSYTSNNYKTVVTPPSQIINNLASAAYQMIQPVGDLSSSRISTISVRNKEQIRQDGRGGVIKTTTIQEIIPVEITRSHYFSNEIKALLGLHESDGIPEVRLALQNLQMEQNNEIQRLRIEISTKERQKIEIQESHRQLFFKFQENVRAIENAEKVLDQRQHQQQLLASQNNKIREHQLWSDKEIRDIKENLERIVLERENSTIRHKNQMQTQLYVQGELQCRVERLNNELEQVRSSHQRNRSQFDIRQFQLQEQIKRLQQHIFGSQKLESDLKRQINHLSSQKQQLQTEIVNRSLLYQQKDATIQEARVRINSLNERIAMLGHQQQQSEIFAFEFQKLQIIHKQLQAEFAKKEEAYLRDFDIEKKRTGELLHQLIELDILRTANRDQSRKIEQLQHLARTKDDEILTQQAGYRTEIFNLKTMIDMKVGEIQLLSTLTNQVPAEFMSEFDNLKKEKNALSRDLNLQKKMMIDERERVLRESQMKLGALRVEYESRLTDLNRKCEEIQRRNDARMGEQTNRYSSLMHEYEKNNNCWDARYSKLAEQLHHTQIQMSAKVSEVSGSAVEELRRVNAELQHRLREDQMEKQRLNQMVGALRNRQSDIERTHRQKFQQIEIFKSRMDKQHRDQIHRREKDFEYQRSILAAQYQDGQESIKNLNYQRHQLSNQLAEERKRYMEVTSTVRTEMVDNPALIYELRQKSDLVSLLNAELQDARNSLRASEEQWKHLERENSRLISTFENQKIELNRNNYQLKCQVSDLNQRLETQMFDLKLKNNSISMFPTAPSIDYISSLKIIDHIQPVIAEKVHTFISQQPTFSVEKTAVFQNYNPSVLERVQKISTPSRIKYGNAVPASPLSAVTTNEAVSRCVTAQTTISAAPTSRINFSPTNAINKSPSRIILNVTPPKIVSEVREVHTKVQGITSANGENKSLHRVHSPQINYNNRLRSRHQQQVPRSKIEMRSNRPIARLEQPNLVNQKTVVTVTGVKETHIGTTNSKLMNNLNRSNSRQRSPHIQNRPPLSPPLLHTSRSRQIKNVEVIKNIPPIPVPITPMTQFIQTRRLSSVRSTPSLPIPTSLEAYSTTSINNLIVQKQVSRQQSLRTSAVVPNLFQIPTAVGGSIESYVSEGDYGMNVMQKQEFDRRNCC